MDGEQKQTVVLGNEKIRWAVIGVLALLGLFLAAETVAAVKGWRYIGGGVPVTNTVTVSGEGEVFMQPDVATFSFSVVEEKATVAEAQEVATEKANRAIAYLKGEGIEEKDIRTAGYNVYPKYDYTNTSRVCSPTYCPPPGEPTIRGYEVSQTIEVKVRDTQKAGTLLSGIGQIGVQNVSGLVFTIDDEEEVLREARAKAIEDAKEKAEQLASDLGVRLVRVVSFYEERGGYPIPLYEKGYALGLGGDASVESAAPSIPTGENQIVSRINITYEIR